jgi:hypothetical protein
VFVLLRKALLSFLGGGGVTCEEFQPEIRFARLWIHYKKILQKEALTWCRKDWLKETVVVVIEPRDCKSLLTGRTCTRDDFLFSRQLQMPQIPQSNAVVKCNCSSCSSQTLWLFAYRQNILSSSFKFGPEKSDFDLYKGFFHGKKLNSPAFQGKKKSKSPNF